MFGDSQRKGRGDMQDVIAILDGLWPTLIFGQVGDNELQLINVFRTPGFEHIAYIPLSF